MNKYKLEQEKQDKEFVEEWVEDFEIISGSVDNDVYIKQIDFISSILTKEREEAYKRGLATKNIKNNNFEMYSKYKIYD